MRFASHLGSELRLTLRALWRHPAYSLPVLVTLCLGTAAVVVVAAVLRATLFAPLPFPHGEELAALDVESTKGYSISVSVPNFEDWRERNRSFSHFAMASNENLMLSGRGATEVVNVVTVLGDFFETLGARVELGQPIAGARTGKGAEPVAVLSHATWQRRFGADPGVLGTSVSLDGRPYTIVGVLAEGQAFPDPAAEFFLPMGVFAADLPWTDRDSSFGARAFGRLRPGVALADADADLQRVWRDVTAKEGKPVARPIAHDLRRELLGDKATSGRLAGLAVLLLYALATANALHLALARAGERRAELGVRAALGASRGRQVLLLGLEAAALVALATILGLLTGAGALAAARPWLAGAEVPALHRVPAIDMAVIAALALLGLVSAAVLTLAPAVALGRGAAAEALRGRRAGRGRALLLATEVAATVVLVAVAGVLARSEALLGEVDKGFDARGVYAARLVAPDNHFRTEASWLATYERVLAEARRLPGVEHAAFSITLPLSHRSWEMGVQPGAVALDNERAESVLFNMVSEDEFATLGIPVLAGRAFTPADRTGAPLVAVVDETLARHFWPDGSALGRQVTLEAPGPDRKGGVAEVRTIVGIVRNVRHYQLEQPSRIQIYVPIAQGNGRYDISLELAVRGALPPGGLEQQLRQVAVAVDPELAFYRPGFVERFVDAAYGPRRELGRLFAAFGMLALLLAAAGVFAVMTHAVAARQGELGIRSALGAAPRDLLALVLRAALTSGALGALFGGAGGAAFSASLRSMLFGVGAFDAPSQLGSATLVLVAVVCAALAPALRAARVQPARLLAAGDRRAR